MKLSLVGKLLLRLGGFHVSFNMIAFVLLLTATGLMLFISILSFRSKHLIVARYSGLVMIAASFYSLGYAFEFVSMDLESITFWLKVEYIGIPFIATLWLLLVIHFTGFHQHVKKWIPLLFVIPVLTLIFHYTNDSHHLFYKDMTLISSEDMTVVETSKGPWYWVHILYTYLQAIVGIILFSIMYLRSNPRKRMQILLMMMGVLAPFVANLVYLSGSSSVPLDFTPLGFVLTGYFYIRGIYRFNMLQLVPTALQNVFDHMNDGVLIFDKQQNLTEINPAAMELLNWGNVENDFFYKGKELFNDFPEVLNLLRQTKNGECLITIKTKHGEKFLNVKMSLLVDSRNQTKGRIFLINDMTEITLNQERLLKNATQIAEFSSFKDKLFTVVAHDIRDPLAMLVNLTDILEEELEEAESESMEVFLEVSEQVKGTYLMVEKLLDWYRSQNGNLHFSPLAWKASSMVEHALIAMQHRLELKKIQIKLDLDNDLTVFADKEMMDLVFRNLLSNAIKYSPLSGDIRISSSLVHDKVRFVISDDGPGIDDKIAENLFRKVSVLTSDESTIDKGSGLGLYLSTDFVELNNGEIGFESVKEKGSSFYITLPQKEWKSV